MDTAANYSIFSTNKTQNPELDEKSSKDNVNIYILIIFIDIILVRITMKKIIFTKRGKSRLKYPNERRSFFRLKKSSFKN